jgi:hypothetical protein
MLVYDGTQPLYFRDRDRLKGLALFWRAKVQRSARAPRCFSSRRRLLGVSEIADELGPRRNTAHRYMMVFG